MARLGRSTELLANFDLENLLKKLILATTGPATTYVTPSTVLHGEAEAGQPEVSSAVLRELGTAGIHRGQ